MWLSLDGAIPNNNNNTDLFIGVFTVYSAGTPLPHKLFIFIAIPSIYLLFSFERSIKVMGRDCESTCLNNSNGWIRAGPLMNAAFH